MFIYLFFLHTDPVKHFHMVASKATEAGLTRATHTRTRVQAHVQTHTSRPWPDFFLCVTVAPAVLPASSQQLFPAKLDERHVKAAERRTRPHTRVVMQC